MSRRHTDWRTEYRREKCRKRRNVDRAWQAVVEQRKADKLREAALMDRLTAILAARRARAGERTGGANDGTRI